MNQPRVAKAQARGLMQQRREVEIGAFADQFDLDTVGLIEALAAAEAQAPGRAWDSASVEGDSASPAGVEREPQSARWVAGQGAACQVGAVVGMVVIEGQVHGARQRQLQALALQQDVLSCGLSWLRRWPFLAMADDGHAQFATWRPLKDTAGLGPGRCWSSGAPVFATKSRVALPRNVDRAVVDT
ncbi:hypothetical protein FQR65_LT20549 [Abscondita terminalis]|nr:hypothetical protein FQR65_LT20549 [Abscondita terminalis]